jgi:hypothetical protein
MYQVPHVKDNKHTEIHANIQGRPDAVAEEGYEERLLNTRMRQAQHQDTITQQIVPKKGDECEKSSYVGAGFSFLRNVVIEVPQGYGAAKAGIHLGDVFEGNDEPNASRIMHIRIQRGNKHLVFAVRAEKVCIS